MLNRTISCDVVGCTHTYTEEAAGVGFPGWGALHGIELNGVPNPSLCPQHLAAIADFVDTVLSPVKEV